MGSEVVESPPALYHYVMSLWRDPGEVVPGTDEPLDALARPDEWARLPTATERTMYLDAVTHLPGQMLTKVDRAAMAVSLEARVPLLDPRIIAFAARLPLAMKVHRGTGKWILRQLAYRYVPRALLDRPKHGFNVPISAWLRGPLRPWAEALLDERRLRQEGYLAAGAVRARWNDLLELAYSRSPDDASYRAAVRRAAEDLSQRAPVPLPCRDAQGHESDCRSTEDVLRGFNARSDEVGIRGALDRLLRRLFGGGPS